MGATELQIFVSLVVVLGAAFVALICDFLKGSNERLREANLELQVRQDHFQVHAAGAVRPQRTPVVAALDDVPVQAAAGPEQALARKVFAAHRQPGVKPAAEQTVEEVLIGGRRRTRRARPEAHPQQPGDWARQLVERQIPLPTASPLTLGQAPAAGRSPVEPAHWAVEQTAAVAPAVPALPVDPGAAQEAPALAALAGLTATAAAPPAQPQSTQQPLANVPVPVPPSFPAGVEVPSGLEQEPIEAGLVSLEAIASRMAAGAPHLPAAAPLAAASREPVPHFAPRSEAEPSIAGLVLLPGSLPMSATAATSYIAVSPLVERTLPLAPESSAVQESELRMPGRAGLENLLPARIPVAAAVPLPELKAAFQPFEPVPPALGLTIEEPAPAECSLEALSLALPTTGRAVLREAATPLFEGQAALLPAIPLVAEGQTEPTAAMLVDMAAPAPLLVSAAPATGAPLPLLSATATPLAPALALSLESALPVAAPALLEEPAEAAAKEEEDTPVVRIRVLREEPSVSLEAEAAPAWDAGGAGELTQLQDLFEEPAEPQAPLPAGLIEQPWTAVSALSSAPPVENPAVSPAWTAAPAIPRDKVIELPLNPLTAHTVRTMPVVTPLLEVPQGWHDARTLNLLLADPLPFEGLVACVSITDYARLVQEFGTARCEEAARSLEVALGNVAGGADFICRSAEEEIVMLLPRLPVSEHSARVRLLAEVLWDYQLRTLSLVPVLCGWGASEAAREPLTGALARARSQMHESQRFRRGGSTILGRFRRRAVNA